uniref:Protein kinase domain-containing protein n=1 Tax=Parascaris univalens TaxID=6257 RepID=A0A914ZEM8_PARUN
MRIRQTLYMAIIVWLVKRGNTMINLFISKAEMIRTLGLSAELNYIENGIINTYSTKFPYRVDTNISQVVFSWNTKILDRKIAYKLRAIAGDNAVLPVILIPHRGYLPTSTEEYRCAGNKAGQFDVILHVNFSWPSDTNNTYVTLKQEKLCASRSGRRLTGNLDEYDQNGLRMDGDESGVLITGENVFYMVIGCVGAVVLVIGVLLVVYFRSTRKTLPPTVLPANIQQRYPSVTRSPDFNAQSRPLFNSEASAMTSRQAANVQQVVNERPSSVDVNAALIELYADRNLFQILPINELEGTFGEMRWAIWRRNIRGECGDNDNEEDNACNDEAIVAKTLKNNADKTHLMKFLEQALVFHNIPPFPYLAQVVAAASYGRFDCPEAATDFPLICYKHQGFGNLKKFLQRCRGGTIEILHKTPGNKGVQTLRTHELVSMAIQIIKAILHLHKYGIIHKDIATRNCLVSEVGRGSDRLLVQLCDTALSKDLFPSDYHCLGDNENRPVKWMAYESLQSNTFNSATDAWSFGVTLWELLSCAQQPYIDVDPEEMATILEQGQRLIQPYN